MAEKHHVYFEDSKIYLLCSQWLSELPGTTLIRHTLNDPKYTYHIYSKDSPGFILQTSNPHTLPISVYRYHVAAEDKNINLILSFTSKSSWNPVNLTTKTHYKWIQFSLFTINFHINPLPKRFHLLPTGQSISCDKYQYSIYHKDSCFRDANQVILKHCFPLGIKS